MTKYNLRKLGLLLFISLPLLSACSCTRRIVEPPPFNESFHKLVESAIYNPSSSTAFMYYSALKTSELFKAMDAHCYPGFLFALDDTAFATYLNSIGITLDEFKAHPKKDEFFAVHFIPEFINIKTIALEYITVGGNTISLKDISVDDEKYNFIANNEKYKMHFATTFSSTSGSTSLDNSCAEGRKTSPDFPNQLFRVGYIDRPIVDIDW